LTLICPSPEHYSTAAFGCPLGVVLIEVVIPSQVSVKCSQTDRLFNSAATVIILNANFVDLSKISLTKTKTLYIVQFAL
jgi:hypothetical protein